MLPEKSHYNVALIGPTEKTGGVGRVHQEILSYLSESGHSVDLVNLGLASLGSFLRKGRKYDIIVCSLYGIPIARMVAAPRTTCIALCHGFWLYGTDKQWRNLASIFYMHFVTKNRFRLVIAPSWLSHFYYSLFCRTDIIVVPWGVSLCSQEHSTDTIKAYNEREVDILYVGRLVREKGIYELLEFSDTLEAQDLRIVIAGTGEGHIDIIRMLEMKALRNVEYLGRISDEIKFGLFGSSRCLWSLYDGEAFGLSMVEALCYGAKIIAGRQVPFDHDSRSVLLTRINHPNSLNLNSFREIHNLGSQVCAFLLSSYPSKSMAEKYKQAFSWGKVCDTILDARDTQNNKPALGRS